MNDDSWKSDRRWITVNVITYCGADNYNYNIL